MRHGRSRGALLRTWTASGSAMAGSPSRRPDAVCWPARPTAPPRSVTARVLGRCSSMLRSPSASRRLDRSLRSRIAGHGGRSRGAPARHGGAWPRPGRRRTRRRGLRGEGRGVEMTPVDLAVPEVDELLARRSEKWSGHSQGASSTVAEMEFPLAAPVARRCADRPRRPRLCAPHPPAPPGRRLFSSRAGGAGWRVDPDQVTLLPDPDGRPDRDICRVWRRRASAWPSRH